MLSAACGIFRKAVLEDAAYLGFDRLSSPARLLKYQPDYAICKGVRAALMSEKKVVQPFYEMAGTILSVTSTHDAHELILLDSLDSQPSARLLLQICSLSNHDEQEILLKMPPYPREGSTSNNCCVLFGSFRSRWYPRKVPCHSKSWQRDTI